MKSSDKSRKNNKNKRVGRPAPILYQLFMIICAATIRLRGVKIRVDRSGIRDIKGPALVLAPHISLKDHILVGLTLLPKRPTFVLSEHFIAKPILNKLLKPLAKVITKKMFCPDVSTIMNIMRAKNEGNIIVLFPEGRLNAVAHSQPVAEGTAALVKKLGVDVYTVAGNGSALAFPKWGKKYRRGEIRVTAAKLLSAQDIASMPVESISDVIDKAIYHDDEKAASDRIFKCREPAKGLDGVLYKCPECEAEFCIIAGDNSVKCTDCGFEAELGEDYHFKSGRMQTVNQWYYWQKDSLDMESVLEDDIVIGAVGKNGIMDFNAGKGHIKLTKNEFSLCGEVFGEHIEFTRNTAKIGGTPFTPMREFDIYYNKQLLYLMPADGRRIIKYVNMVDRAAQLGKEKQ